MAWTLKEKELTISGIQREGIKVESSTLDWKVKIKTWERSFSSWSRTQ